MRVMMITQFFDPEPATIQSALAAWLVDHGHEVEVVTGIPNYPGGRFYDGYRYRLLQRENFAGARVSRVLLYPSHDRSSARRVANYVSFSVSAATVGTAATRPCDVTYVYHPPATVALPAMVWKRTRGQRFVVHVQDLWPESVVGAGMISSSRATDAVERLLDAWCKKMYREAESVAVIAPGMKSLLVQRGVPADKAHVIPNWTDERLFHPRPRDAVLARSYGFEGSFNVVYSGNLGDYQALDAVIRAAARVRHLPRLRVVFIGTGPMETELRELATRLAADNVRFLGTIPYHEVGPVSSLADVLLVSLRDLPFFASTIPGKTQVALASGRPVIMAVAGDAADIVRQADAGLLCRPDDEVALAEALERAYGLDETELDAMGARGRAYYVRELSLDQGARRIAALLEQAAQSGASARRS